MSPTLMNAQKIYPLISDHYIRHWITESTATAIDQFSLIGTASATGDTWTFDGAWDGKRLIPYPYDVVTSDPPKRRAPPKEFNKYINTSDLLEEFIQFLGDQAVRQKDVFKMPMEFFIKWLVIRACEEDEEPPNVELPALPAPKGKHRCLGCGQFMLLAVLLPLHGGQCAEKYFAHKEEMENVQ